MLAGIISCFKYKGILSLDCRGIKIYFSKNVLPMQCKVTDYNLLSGNRGYMPRLVIINISRYFSFSFHNTE